MAGPLITDGKIFTVTYDSRLQGQQVLNTFHFRTALLTGTGIELTNFYTQLDGEFSALAGKDDLYALCFTSDLTQIKRRQQVIYPTRYMADVRSSNTSPGARMAPAVAMAPNVTAILTLRTLVAVPRNLSNVHFAATDPGDVTGGIVQAQIADPMKAFADSLLAGFTLTSGASSLKCSLIIPVTANLATSHDAEARAVQPNSRVLKRRGLQLGS